MSIVYRWSVLSILLALVVAVSVAGCGSSAGAAADAKGRIVAVGAENEYANVIAQIGGRYVSVTRDREQPEHRSAHVRGQSERRADGRRGAAGGPERRRV